MKISEMITKLQGHLDKHGDIEVKQLMSIQTPEFSAEKIIPIKRIKYNKKRNICFIDFV